MFLHTVSRTVEEEEDTMLRLNKIRMKENPAISRLKEAAKEAEIQLMSGRASDKLLSAINELVKCFTY